MSQLTQKHPKGLYVLFFTEMWERFGYYLMVGIFFLYLKDTEGKGMDTRTAIDIVGTYIALVYLAPFIGGMIADRYIGYLKAIFIGGGLMALGYFGLAINGSDNIMYLSLLSIIVGNGFFKPNISTLLGIMYSKDELKPKKDSAYNIFYMGINIGAFFCNFVAAYLRNAYGWGYAFAAAGVGMLIGILILASFVRHVRDSDIKKPISSDDLPFSKIALYVFLPAIIFGIIGWMIKGTIFGTDSSDAFMFACIPIVTFYVSLWVRAKKEEKSSIAAILVVYAIALVFWVIYNQNSTAQTIWADTYTDRSISPALQPVADKIGMLQTIDASPTDTIPVLNENFVAQLDANGEVITTVGVNTYFQNLPKEEWPADGESVQVISPELFQSINPFFIVLFTPLIIGLFAWLAKRKREPSTPWKIVLGVLFSGLSMLLMAFAAMSTNIAIDKTAAAWLISSYAVFTIGELFLSPIGLSFISKISPPRLTALMMGGWFLITSIGGKLAGTLASSWDIFTNKTAFFMIMFVAATVVSVAVLFIIKWLNRIVKERGA